MDTNITTSATLSFSAVIPVIYLMVQFFGVLGNALVIFVIAKDRRLKSNYYDLVLHLAVCDFALLLSLTIKYAVFPWINAQNPTSLDGSCKIFEPIKQHVYNCEVFLMVTIGVLRHRAIVHPFKQPLTRTHVKGIAVVGHVLAFLLQTPYSFTLENKSGTVECMVTWEKQHPSVFKAYECIQIILRFAIPIIALAFLYMKMSYALLLHHRLMVSTTDNEKVVIARLANAKQIRNTKAAMVGATVVIFFCVGKLPVYVVQLMISYGIHVDPIHNFWAMLWWVVCTCTVNPVIYGFADQTFLLAFKRTLKGFVK